MDEDVPTLSLRKRNWRLNLTPSIIHMVNEYPPPPRFLPTVLQIHPPKGPPRLEVIAWC